MRLKRVSDHTFFGVSERGFQPPNQNSFAFIICKNDCECHLKTLILRQKSDDKRTPNVPVGLCRRSKIEMQIQTVGLDSRYIGKTFNNSSRCFHTFCKDIFPISKLQRKCPGYICVNCMMHECIPIRVHVVALQFYVQLCMFEIFKIKAYQKTWKQFFVIKYGILWPLKSVLLLLIEFEAPRGGRHE